MIASAGLGCKVGFIISVPSVPSEVNVDYQAKEVADKIALLKLLVGEDISLDVVASEVVNKVIVEPVDQENQVMWSIAMALNV